MTNFKNPGYMPKKVQAGQGFTLIELVIVTVIIGVISFVLAVSITTGIEAWGLVKNASRLGNSTWFALERMSRHIRQIKDMRSIYTAADNDLEFVELFQSGPGYQQRIMRFSLSGNLLNMTEAGEVYQLAGEMASLKFTYWSRNSQQLSIPIVYPQATDIWNIQVELSTQSGNETVSLRSQIHPRDLK